MCTPGYLVRMHVWAECTNTHDILIGTQFVEYTVQPPVWTQGDVVALEMHLDHLVKLRYLANLRKMVSPSTDVEKILKENNFIIRGRMASWQSPVDHEGKFIYKSFPENQLRCA